MPAEFLFPSFEARSKRARPDFLERYRSVIHNHRSRAAINNRINNRVIVARVDRGRSRGREINAKEPSRVRGIDEQSSMLTRLRALASLQGKNVKNGAIKPRTESWRCLSRAPSLTELTENCFQRERRVRCFRKNSNGPKFSWFQDVDGKNLEILWLWDIWNYTNVWLKVGKYMRP